MPQTAPGFSECPNPGTPFGHSADGGFVGSAPLANLSVRQAARQVGEISDFALLDNNGVPKLERFGHGISLPFRTGMQPAFRMASTHFSNATLYPDL